MPRPPRRAVVPLVLAALVLAARTGAAATLVPANVSDEFVAGGFDFPTNLTFLPDGRALVVEQVTARVRVVTNPDLGLVYTMGTVPEIRSGGEAGLLGVAVDPAWPAKPYVYVQGTHAGSNSERIWRFRVTGDLTGKGNRQLNLDAASKYVVLQAIPDSAAKHNGGTLRFGPDGRLYSGVGDDDAACRAQDRTKLQGKILRLDVSTLPDGPGGPPPFSAITPADNPFVADPDSAARLVWVLGLRNPFSFTIDDGTGCLTIGDVGNEAWEEIDRACAGGLNFGWPVYEGAHAGPASCTDADTAGARPPIYDYPHVGSGWSVVAGPLYHAPPAATFPFPAQYEGKIFFGDTWRAWLARLAPSGPGWALAESVAGQPSSTQWATPAWVTSMLTGPDGALWYTILYRDDPVVGPGEVRRLVSHVPTLGVPAPRTTAMALAPPWPNPSRGAVRLAWNAPGESKVGISIVDVAGRAVRRLPPATGSGQAAWDGTNDAGARVAAGCYFAWLSVDGGRVAARPLVLLR